jgi:glycosyltransferase involved in cell wall biosynthesis
MLTSVGDRCGIAAYTSSLIQGLETIPDVSVEVVPIEPGRQPTAHYVERAERLNAADIDCVHIQHEYSFWGSVLPKRWGYWEQRYLIQKPVVITAHTTYDLEDLLHLKRERRPLRRLAKQMLLRRKDYRDSIEIAPFITGFAIVHTAAARNALIARGANGNFITIIPAGVPAATPAADGGSEFRRRFGLEGRRTVTLFGFIAINKGYEATIELLPQLPPDVTLVIAGGVRTPDMEPYRAGLEERIASLGLTNRVVITGFLPDSDLPGAMAASDVVIAPHTEATNSYSVMIPLSHGRPTVASDVDCFREVSARVDCLEVFKNGDREDYLAKLTRVLGDPERRAKLSTNALKYATRCSWPRVAGMTVKVYESAIATYARGHHPHH